MPIIEQTKVGRHIAYALWQITESEEELLANLSLNEIELDEFQTISHKRKRLEWLGARNALKILLQPHGQFYIYKDSNGKPFLDDSTIGISMSHAGQFGAAAIHLNGSIGIDVEIERLQVLNIAKKFLHPQESKTIPKTIEELTRVWSTKEALYKLFGRKQITFKTDLVVAAESHQESPPFKKYLAGYKNVECITLHYCPVAGLHITIALPVQSARS